MRRWPVPLAPVLCGVISFVVWAMAVPVAAQVPADEATVHTVQPGETLGGIAERAKVPRILIAEANGLKAPYAVRTGQKLKIPRTRHHIVKSGETGFAIAYEYAVPWKDIAVASGLDPDKPVKAGQKLLIPTIIAPAAPPRKAAAAPRAAPSMAAPVTAISFAWPVQGKVRRGYVARGEPSQHDGIDITATGGTAVRAAAAGKVLFAGDKGDYGNLVILEHAGGWHTAYGFLRTITVVKDETVNKGERIGLVGDTGLAKGDELHFEVRRDNKPLDPRDQLP